jgi:hypothetical protein
MERTKGYATVALLALKTESEMDLHWEQVMEVWKEMEMVMQQAHLMAIRLVFYWDSQWEQDWGSSLVPMMALSMVRKKG